MGTAADARAGLKSVWSGGNWDAMADRVAGVGPRLLDAIGGVGAGVRLLDVGAGSGGSIAIPAAKRGAEVVASDITDSWFEAGRRRAAAAGVEVEWVVAAAGELPFEDDSFDIVTSTFGHMFDPDQAGAARELARVVRPTGTIGFAAWTPTGKVGQMFGALAALLPPPPEGFTPPVWWGSEERVAALLEPLGLSVSTEVDTVLMQFDSPEEQAAMMEANFGPIVALKAGLGDRWPEARAALVAYFAETNEADDGRVASHNEYLRTIARPT